MSEHQGHGLSITAFLVSLLALAAAVVALLVPRPTVAPTNNAASNTPTTTPPASTLQLAHGEGLNVTDVQPDNAAAVVLPFDIVVTTDKPAAGAVSQGQCTPADPAKSMFVFVAELADLSQVPKQLVNHFAISQTSLGAPDPLKSCTLTISLFGASSSHVEQQVSYTFAQ